jgi:fatty acid desaturase
MATPAQTPTMTGASVVTMLKGQWVNIVFFLWLFILTILFIVYTARFVNSTSTQTTIVTSSGTSTTRSFGASGDVNISNGTIFGIQFLTGTNIVLLIILFIGAMFYLHKNARLEERPYILTMLHTSILFSMISLSIICLKKINSKRS